MRRSLRRCFWSFVLLVLPFTASGGTTEQTLTFKLYPQAGTTCYSPFGGLCPITGADGGVVTTVTCQYDFVDPLPAASVVTQFDARISILPDPAFAGRTGSVELNVNDTTTSGNPVTSTFPLPSQDASCPDPPLFPGGVTSFVSVSAPGFNAPTGLSKYNYRLNALGSPNVDQWNQPKVNDIRLIVGSSDIITEFVEVTLHYIPPPRITFEITSATPDNDRKLLMSKARREDTYLSQYQQRIAGTDADRDGKMDIIGTLTDADGVPLPFKFVYLRVGDPPDPSPYAAVVSAPRDNNLSSARVADTVAITDGSGQFHTFLTLVNAAAGDNYQVEASTLLEFAETFNCREADNCFHSGVITAWKRVYLEVDRMFRAGVNLSKDALASSTRVDVDSTNGLSAGMAVLFVHAPDSMAAGPTAGQFYSEVHVIKAIHGRRHPVVVLDSPLINSYYWESSAADALGNHLADAIGVIHAPNKPTSGDLYDARLDFLQPLFNSTFVDYLLLDCQAISTCDDVPYVPHYGTFADPQLYARLAQKWSYTRTDFKENANHQHLLAGEAGDIGHFGDSSIDDFDTAPFSWVWDKTIGDLAGGIGVTSIDTFAAETVAHELAHQWDVNPPSWKTHGHCQEQTWDNGGECLMNGTTTADRGNGHVAFHNYADPTSEYRRIRQQANPLPQTSMK